MTIHDGFATFPIHPILEGKCGCGDPNCKDAGKHPRGTWRDVGRGERRGAPYSAGYGIATGERSGVFVVDVDGMKALEALDAKYHVPETFIVNTGRGDGWHIYFKYPTDRVIRNSVSKILPGVDIRGEGGYVVGPGSPHRSGATYKVVNDAPIAEAPGWLLDLVTAKKEPKAEQDAAPVPIDPGSEEGVRRIGMAKQRLLTAEPAIEGQNGSGALWNVAQYLVRSLELPLELCAELVEEIYNPRCEPDWSEYEIWHKLEDARDRGTWLCGVAPADWEPTIRALAKVAQAPIKVAADESGKRRMVPNANHTYSFTPGDRPNGEKFKITFANAIADLVTNPEWEGVLQFDRFRQRVYAVNPPMKMDAEGQTGLSDNDGKRIAAWFEVNNQYLISPDTAYSAAIQAAHRNAYHPILEWLDSLPAHTGPSILDTLATKVFGCTDPMSNVFLKKTLIAAVRRLKKPGTKFDLVLVLCGAQGAKKTTFLQVLFGAEWVRSQMPDLANKDSSLALLGFWLIELAEMDRILKSENSTVKEFLTRNFDDFRPPYGKSDLRFPRSNIFIATTNEQDFLVDSTGNRRYLPIRVTGKIDTEFVAKYRDRIWAEAVALEVKGEAHFFEDDGVADASREQFVREDPWHEMVQDYLKGRDWVNAGDVYKECIAKGDAGLIARETRREQMRVADTLKRLGCKAQVKGERRGWVVPETLQKATPSAEELQRRKSFNSIARLMAS